MNYLLIKSKLNNNGVNMPKPIQFKKLLLLMLVFSSSTNVLSDQIIKSYIKNLWQDSRYIDHRNGTVTDTKTALMWKQCAEGLSGKDCSKNIAGDAVKLTYTQAVELVKNSTFKEYDDWRLPNIKELESLVAYDRAIPAINLTRFPKTPSSGFWSSSPKDVGEDTGESKYSVAWVLDFVDGKNDSSRRKSSNPHATPRLSYVRLVRGGE
jgi:hypothetical protein